MTYVVGFLVVLFVIVTWGILRAGETGRYVPNLDKHERHDAAVTESLVEKHREMGEANPFVNPEPSGEINEK